MKTVPCLVIVSLLVSLAAPTAHAQGIRASVDALKTAPAVVSKSGQSRMVVASPVARSGRPKPARVLLVLLGAAGGFVGGAAIGAKLEGHRCECDDPGLKGAMIGAPIGAIGGGVLTWKLTK